MTSSTTAYNADHYVSRLDLGADPFSSNHKSDYYYTSEARQQLLDQLVHFGRFSDQVVMLVGATGSGTSTLLDRAIYMFREVMDCCYINAEVMMTPEQVIESLCQQLHLHLDEPASNSDFFASLRSVISVDDDVEPILLAVDQAHFLPLDGYELLHSIVAESGNMLKLVLVGEYQIEQLTGLAKFDQEKIKLLELEPLSQIEVGEYLLGLLQSVGFAGEQPFSADQLAVLHQQSGGNIAELLQLAPALLSSKPVQQQAHFGFGIPIPIPHLVATVIIVTALILVWLYQGSDEPAPVRRVEVPLQTKILTDNSEHKGVNQQGIVKRVIPGTLETITPKLDTADKLPLDKTMEKQAEARVIQPVEKPVAVKPLPTKTSLPKPANEQKQVVKTTKKPVVSKQEVAELKVTSPPVTAKNKPLSPREQRLMALAGTDYMLQLMGAVDEQRTERLVKRYAGRLPVTYFETRYKGKPWFVAIVGPYKSKELATQKLKLLPSELQKQSPWARSLASIQQDIRAKQP